MGYNSDYIQELLSETKELKARIMLLEWENNKLREKVIKSLKEEK